MLQSETYRYSISWRLGITLAAIRILSFPPTVVTAPHQSDGSRRQIPTWDIVEFSCLRKFGVDSAHPASNTLHTAKVSQSCRTSAFVPGNAGTIMHRFFISETLRKIIKLS